MKNIEEQYLDLLKDILDNGVKKTDRTGTGTLSVFGRQIRHKMSDGFPLLTTKKMAWKSMVVELIWFLNGDTNIRYLVENNCNIWNGDAYKRYSVIAGMSTQVESLTREEFVEKIKTDSEFAEKWGSLGPVYGKQWRGWSGASHIPHPGIGNETSDQEWYRMGINSVANKTIDQIKNSINLLKKDPDSRRNRVSAWNVSKIEEMVLPPCHTDFQFYTRELTLEEKVDWLNKNYPLYDLGEWSVDKLSDENYLKEVITEYNVPQRAISLMFNMRSSDIPLGLPFNISSYALLLEIFGKMVNMVPDELIGNLGDTHIYLNQVDGVKEQLTREPYELPILKHMKTDHFYKSLSEDLSLFSHLETKDFQIEGYKSHPTIKIPLSN